MAIGDSESFKKRKSFVQIFKDYDFFRRSYEGGSAYRDGKFLIQHPREKGPDYERRLEQASFVNFCRDVVEIYVSYLYREQPERKAEKSDEVLEAFLKNADLEGRAWGKVMRNLSKMASYYGVMGAIVDKPKGEAEASRGAELEAGVRPYIAAYTPLAIWDWKFGKDENGVPRLEWIVLEEDNDNGPTVLIKWGLETWERFKQEGDNGSGNDFKSFELGDNNLDQIPFALLLNRDSFKKMTGVSDIADIAPVNRRIYYLDSDALEIIDATAFPILEGPVEAIEDSSGKSQETEIGVQSLLKRPEDKEGFKWIEAPHTSLQQILEHRNSSINDIKYMAKTGQADASKTGQVKSGVALELEFQQLSALMVDKAENAEDFEHRVFELVGLWEDKDYEMIVKYARSFGIRDLMHDLDTAITSKAVVLSPTFQAELAKAFAARILPKDTPPETIEQINNELDNPAPLPGSEDDGDDEGGTA
jgi:hypothetical protein